MERKMERGGMSQGLRGKHKLQSRLEQVGKGEVGEQSRLDARRWAAGRRVQRRKRGGQHKLMQSAMFL